MIQKISIGNLMGSNNSSGQQKNQNQQQKPQNNQQQQQSKNPNVNNTNSNAKQNSQPIRLMGKNEFIFNNKIPKSYLIFLRLRFDVNNNRARHQ